MAADATSTQESPRQSDAGHPQGGRLETSRRGRLVERRGEALVNGRSNLNYRLDVFGGRLGDAEAVQLPWTHSR